MQKINTKWGNVVSYVALIKVAQLKVVLLVACLDVIYMEKIFWEVAHRGAACSEVDYREVAQRG